MGISGLALGAVRLFRSENLKHFHIVPTVIADFILAGKNPPRVRQLEITAFLPVHGKPLDSRLTLDHTQILRHFRPKPPRRVNLPQPYRKQKMLPAPHR